MLEGMSQTSEYWPYVVLVRTPRHRAVEHATEIGVATGSAEGVLPAPGLIQEVEKKLMASTCGGDQVAGSVVPHDPFEGAGSNLVRRGERPRPRAWTQVLRGWA